MKIEHAPRRKALTKIQNVKWAIIIALFIGFLHIVFVLIASGKLANLPSAYHSLFQWDGKHYENIVNNGYYAKRLEWPILRNPFNEKTNVAFFPGYPLLATVLKIVLPLRTNTILILTSQIAFVVLLTYLFLILQRFGLSFIERIAGALLLVSFPAAFFLVCSLSEAVLLASVAGYLYWITRKANFSIMAIAHGIIMTGTKIFGIPMVVLPVITSLMRKKSALVKKQMVTALFALTGVANFLLFCQISFGHWNLYFAVQEASWNINPQYAFFLNYQIVKTLLVPWVTRWPTYVDYAGKVVTGSQNIENYHAISLFIWWLFLWPIIEWITASVSGNHSWKDRVAYYLGAMLSLYLIIATTWNHGLQSAIRYALLPHFLLILTVTHWFSNLPKRKYTLLACFCVLVISLVGFVFQFRMAHAFTNGGWVG